MNHNLLISLSGGATIKILLLFMAVVPGVLFSQQSELAKPGNDLWPIIETQLDKAPNDTTYRFIFLLAKGKCGADTDCLFEQYGWIKNKLERRFHLPAAIAVCEEVASIARQYDKPEIEAKAYVDLYRFHDALGLERTAILNIEKAEVLFSKTGNQEAFIRAKMDELEQSLKHHDIEEVLPKMEALLVKASESGDSVNALRIHILLIEHCLAAKKYGKAEGHISVIENVPISDPVRQPEYKYLIFSALGRAGLAKAKGDLEKALEFYWEALRHCEAEPSRWLEIQTLQSISEIEMESGNFAEAAKHLEWAEAKAEVLKLDDLLAANFKLKATLAELEGRFAEALEFAKKEQSHRELFEGRGAGFDLRNHLLKKEKELLAAEKTAQEKKLQAAQTRMKYSYFFIAAGLLAIGVLTWAFFRQRKEKAALVAKHALEVVKESPSKSSAPSDIEEAMPSPSLSASDREWLERFDRYLKQNLSKSNLTIAMVAQHFAMSESSLLRQVKRLAATTPQKYLKEVRLKKGKELLTKRHFDSVAKVATEVGYGDARSFSRSYKRKFGHLPSDILND